MLRSTEALKVQKLKGSQVEKYSNNRRDRACDLGTPAYIGDLSSVMLSNAKHPSLFLSPLHTRHLTLPFALVAGFTAKGHSSLYFPTLHTSHFLLHLSLGLLVYC